MALHETAFELPPRNIQRLNDRGLFQQSQRRKFIAHDCLHLHNKKPEARGASGAKMMTI